MKEDKISGDSKIQDWSESKFGIGLRSPWLDFPAVIRNGDIGTLKSRAEYALAKQGEVNAAVELISSTIESASIQAVQDAIGNNRPKILPVISKEATGHNKIPLALAMLLENMLELEVELGIIQSDLVARTGSGSDYRIAFNPKFVGKVDRGRDYLIVDDTLTMGGTIASLRGYVEKNGGHVVAAMVMTAHKQVLNIAITPKMIEDIHRKHGTAMNNFFEEFFGYGIDKLTQGEAGHVRAATSVDQFRNRILEARRTGIMYADAG